MADEIRADEPEVEGHRVKPAEAETAKPMAEDEEPEVEGHSVKPAAAETFKATVKPTVKP